MPALAFLSRFSFTGSWRDVTASFRPVPVASFYKTFSMLNFLGVKGWLTGCFLLLSVFLLSFSIGFFYTTLSEFRFSWSFNGLLTLFSDCRSASSKISTAAAYGHFPSTVFLFSTDEYVLSKLTIELLIAICLLASAD